MSAAPESITTDTAPAVTENTEADLYTQANIYLAKQTKPVIIPSFAKWFNINEIHQIERNSLPDFFSQQSNSKYKNASIYKSVRNFIVNTYRLNPIEYLSITAIRRNIAMDVGSLMRIYGFLSKWGLINYQIDPKTKSFAMGPQFTGHFQITLDKPTGFALQTNDAVLSIEGGNELEINTNGDNDAAMDVDSPAVDGNENGTSDSRISFKRQKISNTITPNVKLNLQLRKNVYDSADDAFILQESSANSSKQIKRVYCSITGNDITETKYHNLKNKSNISLDCFENSQFEDYFKSSDYIKLEKTNLNNDSKPWSNSEILLLLEAIEMFGDDWNLISGHVGSRAKDQCITKFIQLPIEDTYLFKHISKSSYVEYLKKLKDNKSVDLSTLLSALNNKNNSTANDNSVTATSTTTTTTTTTTTATTQTTLDFNNNSNGSVNDKIIDNVKLHAKDELENQDAIITSILKLSLRKFELKMQSFMSLESHISEQQKYIDTEKEGLVLDKMVVNKQCSKVRQQLLKAADIVQSAKNSSAMTPEALESSISEAVNILDRAISEARYDPSLESSLTPSKLNNESKDALNDGDDTTSKNDVDMVKPISVIEPKLYSMWSA